MAKQKLPKRLFKQADRISSYEQEGHSPDKLMKRMSREHMDVLQNIEFALVRRFQSRADIDDRIVNEALRACRVQREPEDPIAAELVAELKAMREFRSDVPDSVWQDALQVVNDSVKRHSQCRRGETGYLSFVQKYVR